MFPLPQLALFAKLQCDSPDKPTVVSRASTALQTVKSAMSVPENELKRWRRTFDTNAQTVVGEEKYVWLSYITGTTCSQPAGSLT